MALPTRTALAALSVVTALALTACTGDPEPAPTAKPPSTTTATATPAPPTTPTSTTAATEAALAKIPAAARPNTQAGAEAFGRFFMTQVGKGFAGAGPTVVEGLFTDTCKTCAAFSASMAKMGQEGRRHEKSSIAVDGASANRFVDEDPKKIIAVRVRQTQVDIVAKDGVRVGETRAGKTTFVLTLLWGGEHWLVGLAQVEKL